MVKNFRFLTSVFRLLQLEFHYNNSRTIILLQPVRACLLVTRPNDDSEKQSKHYRHSEGRSPNESVGGVYRCWQIAGVSRKFTRLFATLRVTVHKELTESWIMKAFSGNFQGEGLVRRGRSETLRPVGITRLFATLRVRVRFVKNAFIPFMKNTKIDKFFYYNPKD